jgi:hypothetical protein
MDRRVGLGSVLKTADSVMGWRFHRDSLESPPLVPAPPGNTVAAAARKQTSHARDASNQAAALKARNIARR